MSTIVVGVDGSLGAQKALEVAVREAKEKHASLKVVTAWHVPGYAYGGLGFTPLADLNDAFHEEASATLEKAIAQLGEGSNGLEIEPVVREGRPASVLVEESEGADELVVGSRGLGGFAGLVLGSVSQECAQHAPCSILIVRHEGHE